MLDSQHPQRNSHLILAAACDLLEDNTPADVCGRRLHEPKVWTLPDAWLKLRNSHIILSGNCKSMNHIINYMSSQRSTAHPGRPRRA